jgi:hypothetical protein
MTEREFLEVKIFYDVENLNTGFDNDSIWHFCVDDFKKVMARSEELNIKILGMECWEKEEEKLTKFYEDYEEPAQWHRAAFQELVENHAPCIFTATFDIPIEFLQEGVKD